MVGIKHEHLLQNPMYMFDQGKGLVGERGYEETHKSAFCIISVWKIAFISLSI